MLFPRAVFKRKQFFVLILLVGVVFLVYQILSLNQLGREMALRQFRKNLRTYEKADDFFELRPAASRNTKRQDEAGGSVNVLGVLPQFQRFYSNATSETFHCMLGNRQIPFGNVNDDYCDCEDGSDEPSTSACFNGRFYCTFQQPNGHKPSHVPSSRVNDGICDCCDGSDEWNTAVQLPPHVQLSEDVQVKLRVDQVPCRNRCWD